MFFWEINRNSILADLDLEDKNTTGSVTSGIVEADMYKLSCPYVYLFKVLFYSDQISNVQPRKWIEEGKSLSPTLSGS